MYVFSHPNLSVLNQTTTCFFQTSFVELEERSSLSHHTSPQCAQQTRSILPKMFRNLKVYYCLFILDSIGCFFSESAIRFSNLRNKNIPNYYPELEIWIYILLSLAGNLNLNFKFRTVIWNIFFEIWQRHRTF